MEQFKVFRLREQDKKVVAAFEHSDLDALDAGEVVIEVAYSSVNYKDALAATGAGKIIRRFPCIGGIDLAGRVVSSEDAQFKPGDAVICTSFDLGVAHDGGYAEYARVPAGWVVPCPDGLSVFEAMAFGTAGYTAALGVMRMEHDGLAPERGPVIVTGATGGVGSIAVAILSKLGYDVVAFTGKDSERDYLHSLGAKDIMLRLSVDLSATRPLGSAKWAGAVDNLGGDYVPWLASNMQQAGTIASIGLAAGTSFKGSVMPYILRGVSLLGIDSGYTAMPIRRDVWRRLATDMRPRDLHAFTRTIAFDELPSVFPIFIDSKIKGRVVVAIKGDKP